MRACVRVCSPNVFELVTPDRIYAIVADSEEIRDGWLSLIADMIPAFRRMTEEAGRDPLAITVWHPRQDADLIKRYEDLGVERVVFSFEPEPAEAILPKLDAVAEFMHRVNG